MMSAFNVIVILRGLAVLVTHCLCLTDKQYFKSRRKEKKENCDKLL